MSDQQTTETPTPSASGVNTTPPTNGVTPAQSPVDQIVNTSALIASYEQRLRNMMSEKDKSINERNQAITQLTSMQEQHTTLQSQTSGSLTAAANSAQQAIDRAKKLELDLAQAQAENVKLSHLMQRPHLAPYANLIPSNGTPESITAVMDQLEQIRQHDLDTYMQAHPQSVAPSALPQTPVPQTQQSILSSLYGNRANMNPNLFQVQTPAIPGSSPAQMNPAVSNDPTQAVEALFAEAKRVGTTAAFEDAVKQAAHFTSTLYSRS